MKKHNTYPGNKITLTLKSQKTNYRLVFQDKFRQMSSIIESQGLFFSKDVGTKNHDVRYLNGGGNRGAIEDCNDVLKLIGQNYLYDNHADLINMKEIIDYEINSERVDCSVWHYEAGRD